ncbi:MAG: helix-turn-helix transcriptional regulator, partial [Clostridiales bacterium]|nr:helix-turn-helix transcriptional regulator [Clostridiales bacterium]
MKGKNGIKDRIVEAAWELFHEKGFADTTLNDIIDAA